MIRNLATESTMVSDTNTEGTMEQPVIVEDYEGSEGVSLVAYNGESVFIPYRMAKEVCKVMIQYAKAKPKKR